MSQSGRKKGKSWRHGVLTKLSKKGTVKIKVINKYAYIQTRVCSYIHEHIDKYLSHMQASQTHTHARAEILITKAEIYI